MAANTQDHASGLPDGGTPDSDRGTGSQVSRRGFVSGAVAVGLVGGSAFGIGAAPASAEPLIVQATNGTVGSSPLTLTNTMDAAAWRTHLAAFDFTWARMPKNFYEAPFLGNGGLGASVYVTTTSKAFSIVLGHNAVRDHQDVGGAVWGLARLRLGTFTVGTVGTVTDVDLRLSLYDATLGGTVTTSAGKIELSIFVHAELDVLRAEFVVSGGETRPTLAFVPATAQSPRLEVYPTQRPSGYRDNPAPVTTSDSALQRLVAGGSHATAWSITSSGSRTTLLAGVAASYPADTSLADARAAVSAATARGAELVTSHTQWWNTFYPKSFIAVPDRRLQAFLWIQLYKMASATRREREVLTTTGPWLERTPWPATWWNLNSQLSYWCIVPSGHSELDSLTRSIDEYRDALEGNLATPMADAAAIGITSQEDLVSNKVVTPVFQMPTSGNAPETGDLLWAMHNLWLVYRHTMDEELLANVIVPVLRKAVNFHLSLLRLESDGKLHMPVTFSPEYASDFDANYDLALLTWGCTALLDATSRLGINDPKRAEWQRVLTTLTPAPRGTDGYWIGKSKRLTSSHRHYSHLLWFYPLALRNVRTNATDRAALEASLNTWLGFTGALQGYTFTGASSMSSYLGKGDDALRYLNQLLDSYVQPNTMYKETGPVIETPLSAAQSMFDMVLQSWGDRLRVFPGVPTAWKELVFHELRAQGGFVVSARRSAGTTSWVRVRSTAGEPLRIEHGISGAIRIDRVKVTGGVLSQFTTPSGTASIPYTVNDDGSVTIDMQRYDDVIIRPASVSPTLVIAPISVAGSFGNWGLQDAVTRTAVTQVDLSAAFTLDGIATDGVPGDGNFDGSGYSYPAAQMPAEGTVTSAGVAFRFGSSATGARNAVRAQGQRITVPQGSYRAWHLLGAATGGAASSAGTLHFSDGTTQSVTIALSDWGREAVHGDREVLRTTYRLSSAGRNALAVAVYHQTVSVPTGKQLTAITLPNTTTPRIQLFAMSLEAAS